MGATLPSVFLPFSMSPSNIVFSMPSSSGVSITPGSTAFTRTPREPTSAAAVRVSPRIACFVALYAQAPERPRSLAIEPVLTMAPPPCASITGMT